MTNFNTHHYATKSMDHSTQKADEFTPEQNVKIQQYRKFVDAMNKYSDMFAPMEEKALSLKKQNQEMEGLSADTDTLDQIYKLLYQATELIGEWQKGGDQVTALERQWGLPEGALDY